ncbi:MAG: sulfite exporter TauE/SafE family protein [Gammaproteobacteria bacterium]|nr:sulfite exporter TauE/SafE family protein [Gammaproteobacteria bacterium]
MTPADAQSLLLWLVPLLAATGVLAGILAGLLGVGGGIVIVPMLYYLFSYLEIDETVRMHLAVGTSLATIIVTSIRSVRAHQSRGSFDRAIFRRWTPGLVAGVLLGTWIATLSSFDILVIVFACVALAVAAQMGFGQEKEPASHGTLTGALAWPITLVIGGLSAMMGIGGGAMSVPAMSWFGVPIHRAVGTSAGFGLVIAIPGTLGFIVGGWGQPALPPGSLGYVNLIGFALIVPATILTAPVGARLAHALNPAPLRRAFALFLGITALKMLGDVSGVL